MIRLGVPSKGRLMEQAFSWFAARGVGLARTGSERDYTGRVEGAEGVSLVLLSAGEIPRELAAGRIDLGSPSASCRTVRAGPPSPRAGAMMR